MTCPLTASHLQLKPMSKLIPLLHTQDFILNAIQSVLYLMLLCVNFTLALGPSQTASPPKYDILLSIFPSVKSSSNHVHGPSVTILTGTHWDLIYLPIPNTCTSPSSLLTVFSPPAKLSTEEILLRALIVWHVEKSNPTNIFCVALTHHDFIFAFN